MRGNYRTRGTGPMPSEAVQKPEPKPALGQSHDAYATMCRARSCVPFSAYSSSPLHCMSNTSKRAYSGYQLFA